MRKVAHAKTLRGPRFFHALAPCPPGWRYDADQTIEIGRLATDTHLFPLYEIEEDRYRLTRRIDRPKPITEYLERQGRFDHLGPAEVAEVQAYVDRRYQRLLDLERLMAPAVPA